MMMNNSEIDILILDYVNGTLSQQQEAELFEWVEASAQNTAYFSHSIAYLELSSGVMKSERFNTKKNWKKVASKINQRTNLIKLGKEFAKIAAVFAIAFVLGYFYFDLNPTTETQELHADYIITEVPYGSRSVVTLPDGSRVWINAGSSMSYPVTFDENQRTVWLAGEAFFDVVTNKDRPFFVEALGVKVKATGTRFNVRAYGDEEFIETILIEGEVTVNRSVSPQKQDLLLKPNQRLTIFKDKGHTMADQNLAGQSMEKHIEYFAETPLKIEKAVLTSEARTDIYTSWKEKEWVIYKEKFGSLMKKLEKRYDVSINIKDSSLYDLAYSGTLMDENLKEVLDVLSITSPINYTLDNKNVSIWYNPKF
ncbi:FecR family protein [Sunxiuqinia sp. sy24]|uniref:FecR family protein n=1 Tax=Sunxiuqinia sp. sy24 TaxID=3461495 RepID=UPI0040460274